jgi:hypothetical protein
VRNDRSFTFICTFYSATPSLCEARRKARIDFAVASESSHRNAYVNELPALLLIALLHTLSLF